MYPARPFGPGRRQRPRAVWRSRAAGGQLQLQRRHLRQRRNDDVMARQVFDEGGQLLAGREGHPGVAVAAVACGDAFVEVLRRRVADVLDAERPHEPAGAQRDHALVVGHCRAEQRAGTVVQLDVGTADRTFRAVAAHPAPAHAAIPVTVTPGAAVTGAQTGLGGVRKSVATPTSVICDPKGPPSTYTRSASSTIR